MRSRRYAIIEALSVLGLKPTGVADLPKALLGHRPAERLQARHAAQFETLRTKPNEIAAPRR